MQNDYRGNWILKKQYEIALSMRDPKVNKVDISNDYKVNKTVTMPKKVGAEKCENYRNISLTTHASKILTAIIYRRVGQTIESYLDEDQFGFRKERGTKEALLSLRLI